MNLDLSRASMGRPFVFNGGALDGEEGYEADCLHVTPDGDLLDFLCEIRDGYIRTDLGPRMTFTYEPISGVWRNETTREPELRVAVGAVLTPSRGLALGVVGLVLTGCGGSGYPKTTRGTGTPET
jgi:hypothetical protein